MKNYFAFGLVIQEVSFKKFTDDGCLTKSNLKRTHFWPQVS